MTTQYACTVYKYYGIGYSDSYIWIQNFGLYLGNSCQSIQRYHDTVLQECTFILPHT